MALFKYKAQGSQGIEEGVRHEKDREAVIRYLMAKGLRPLTVEQGRSERQTISFSLPQFFPKKEGKIAAKDVEFFTKQLALLVKGGMSLDQALHRQQAGHLPK